MARYRVMVPAEAAKRKAGRGKIVVSYHQANGARKDDEIYEVPPGANSFAFDVPDSYDWLYKNGFINSLSFATSSSFAVSAIYVHPTKGEKSCRLVPEEI